MNKQRKTSNILNVFQYDEITGAVTLPSTLVLTAPASSDDSTKVPTTAWTRTYISSLGYVTGNQSISITGDASGSGTTSINLTLANTAVTPGTYGSSTLVPVVTVDSKGRITSVSTASISGALTFTGDVTGTGTTGSSTTLTLANSGVTAGTFTKVTVDSKGRVTVGANATTSDISEGTNLYYTDARVLAYLGANSYATQSYVSTQINNLVSGAPGLLDTLDELAQALGDDPNFATTTATSLGNRLRIDIGTQGLSSTQQGYGRTNLGLGSAALSSTGDFATAAQGTKADTAFGWGNHASAGYLTTSSAVSIYVSLTGSYANPSWITSLAYSKITGVPAFLTSYTETDTLQSVILRNGTTNTGFTITNTNDTYSTPGNTNVPVIYLYNTGTTSTANAVLSLRTNSATGGDPILSFDIGGVQGWSMGIDNSDSDKFKIARSWAALDSDTRFSMAVDGTANFTGSLTAANLSGTNTGDQTNISGNAATATSVAWTGVTGRPTALSQFTNDLGNYGGFLTSVTNISGYSGSVNIPDWRDTSYTPAQYDGNRVNWHFNNTSQNGSPAGDFWGVMQTVSPWSEFNTSHRQMQLWWGGSVGLSYRYAVGSGYTPTGWSSWQRVLTSSNFSSWAAPLNGDGASGTWGINVTGSARVIVFSGDSAKVIQDNVWAGTSGYPGYQYTGGNNRFGFSSTGGVLDVYADGNFYATDNSYLVLHTNNISSYAVTSLTDTLGSVTGRGASTATYSTFSGGLNVAASKVGFRNAGLTEFIQGESWTMGIYGYNSNDGFLFYQRDTSDAAHPCFHIGGWNNAAYGGYSNADSMITLVRGDGTKTDGSTYATRGLSSSSYYSNIIKTTDRTIFRDSQGKHQFNGRVEFTTGDGGASSQSTVVAIKVRGYNGYDSLELGTENNYDGVIRSYGNDLRYYAGHWRSVGTASSENHSHYWYTSLAGSTNWSNHKMRLDHDGVLTVASNISTPGILHTNRNRVAFSSTATDANHSIYNNYNNIDGEGSFDGFKMNVYAGLHVRVGNASGAVPTLALDVNSTRTKVGVGQLWCGESNSRDNAVGLVLNDGALHVRAHNDFYHKIWYYDGIAFGTNYAHGHFRFYAETATQRGSNNGGATLVFDINTVNYNATCTGDITAYSDARVKENIELIPNALEKVQKLRGVTFTRTDHPDTNKKHTGVIAQEVLEVLPEVITESEDTGMYTVAYGNMVGLLIEAVKEQQLQIEDLKNRLELLTQNK